MNELKSDKQEIHKERRNILPKITQKRNGKMENISEGIRKLEADILSENDAFQFWLFRQRWSEIAGDGFAEESCIGRSDGDLLWIYAQNSIWLQELVMHKDEILQKIQNDAYGKRFKEIRFTVSSVNPQPTEETVVDKFLKEQKENKLFISVPLTKSEEIWISQFTEWYVKSETLRETFRQLMENSLKERKAEVAEGLTPCKSCGKLCPPKETYCLSCRIQHHKHTMLRIILLLKEQPHYKYDEVNAILPCGYDQYREARDTLIHRYKEHYFRGERKEEELTALLSLLTYKAPSNISKEEVKEKLSGLAKEKKAQNYYDKKEKYRYFQKEK